MKTFKKLQQFKEMIMQLVVCWIIIILKNGTEITLNFSSNLIGNFNNETNFPHKLLLTNTQVSRL